MDQGQLNTLDPKLREAYQRVMGTPVAAKPDVPADQAAQPAAPAAPVQAPVQPSIQAAPPTPAFTPPAQPIAPPPAAPFVVTSAQVDTVQPAPQENNQMHAYVAKEVAGAKQSLKIIQLIYIVGGVVFFAVYAMFWMKFFNVASPF